MESTDAQADASSAAKLSESSNRKRDEFDCVVRALESAFGEKATEGEWDTRMHDVDEVLHLTRTIHKDDPPAVTFAKVKIVTNRDLQLIGNLISGIAHTESPLGIKIKQYNCELSPISGKTVREELKRGSIVIASLRTTQGQDHVANLGLDGDRVVSVSDGNVDTHIVDYPEDRGFYSFVFRKPIEPAAK
jgi:hypothetical protein